MKREEGRLKIEGNERFLVIANGHQQPLAADLRDLSQQLAGTRVLRNCFSGETTRWEKGVRPLVPGLSAIIYELVPRSP